MYTSILLADDHKIFREGLKLLLQQEPYFNVVAEATDGRSAVRFAKEFCPDIIIMDVAMPELNGIEATRQITDGCTEARIIGLSMHADRRFVLEMLRAGAKGYMLKIGAYDELTSAIRTVLNNDLYLSPRIASIMFEDYLKTVKTKVDSAFTQLTAREREVLQLIAEGNTTKQISQLLNISSKTVETHRQQLMDKLNLHNIIELTKYAIREGITPLDA